MIIRRMKQTDIEAVARVGQTDQAFAVSKTCPGFWSTEVLQAWCRNRNDLMLVAEGCDALLGFVFFTCHRPTGKTTFENLWVHPDHRQKGVAQALMARALQYLQRRHLRLVVALVKTGNEPALKCLETQGFVRGQTMLWLDRTF